jgi:tRNA(Ile)-lysidine synthase
MPDMGVTDMATRLAASAVWQVPSLCGQRVVLAVSGGGDSAATAALLFESGIVARESVLAYFDHALRGEEAGRGELAAVEALASRCAARVVCGRWGEPRRAEASARVARYRFLASVAAGAGARFVVTGHTLDDQVETLLLNVVRGTGIYGLCGMAPLRALPGEGEAGEVLLARPMLAVRRAELRTYLRERRLSWVEDSSNEDARFARNAVRRTLAALDAVDRERLVARLAALAASARAARAALDAAVRGVVEVAADGTVRVGRLWLAGAARAERVHVLRLAAERLLGDAREFDRRHYGRADELARARTGATYEFPRGVIAVVERDVVVFGRGGAASQPIPREFEMPVPFRGEVGDWRLEVTPAAPLSEDAMRLPPGALVRGRRPGDRLRLAGGTRKLQDVLVDAGVPRRARDGMPLVALGAEVLWTPVGQAHRAEGDWYAVRAERAR